jgi:hypothetical protein
LIPSDIYIRKKLNIATSQQDLMESLLIIRYIILEQQTKVGD